MTGNCNIYRIAGKCLLKKELFDDIIFKEVIEL